MAAVAVQAVADKVAAEPDIRLRGRRGRRTSGSPSGRFFILIQSNVTSVICMSPLAPASESAFGSKLLSVRMKAYKIIGSMPYFPGVILDVLCEALRVFPVFDLIAEGAEQQRSRQGQHQQQRQDRC